jgi:hypothetical protein
MSHVTLAAQQPRWHFLRLAVLVTNTLDKFVPNLPPTPIAGIMTLPLAIAVLSALALALSPDSMSTAGAFLVLFCSLLNLVVPANPAGYIRYWAGRLLPGGGVEGHAHNAGSHEHISARMVEDAYQGIINWRAKGRRRPYASMQEAELQCEEVKTVLRESGVAMQTLIKRTKAVHPNFQFKKLRVRWQLSDTNKQQRVSICQTLLLQFRRLLHRVVFVDAKTVWMWEEEVCGWVDTSVPNYAAGIRQAYSQGKIIHLKYYAAVHMKLGPVRLHQVLHWYNWDALQP